MSSVILGFFELFTKFYAEEEYSEVAKMFRRVYSERIPWKFFFLAVRLELSLADILLQCRHYQ